MQRYLLSRLVQSILLLIGVLIIVFFMIRLTGDPASLMMPKESTPESLAAFRHAMGFDRPLLVQLGDFLAGALRGDFGNSLRYKMPALQMILERLPYTVALATAALLFAVLVAVPLGLVAGSKPGSFWDGVARLLGLMGQSIANFWLAMVMIVLFAVRLRWFPSFGREGFKSIILPAIALGLPTMGALVRLTRSAVLEIRGEDYIRTAHSKGLNPRRIYVRHILRNAAIPLISVIGIQYGYLLGGSIYIETIFAWAGVGMLLSESVGNRDFPMIQALTFFTSLVVIVINLLTDVAYSVVDPRIRYGR
jgi:ABC-type dipeptide/oligopeptide/nickel transport system permease component